MATRVQALEIGLSIDKQADISTASTTFLHMEKTNEDITSVNYATVNDAAFIGKGNEFISDHGVFPVSQTPSNRIEFWGDATFLIWSLAYAMGDVQEATGLYTIQSLVPGTSLQLPYATIVEQLDESGSAAIDNAYLGCCVEDVTISMNSGPGPESVKVTTNWIGSGKYTSPSSVSLPDLSTNHFLPSSSAALTVIGVDYVAATTIESVTIGIKNNLLEKDGFFPGSGTQNGASVRGRLEYGVRQYTLEFTARLLNNSAEFTKLVGQTTGTVVLTLTYDSTHTITFTYGAVSFERVDYTTVDGIACVHVVCAVKDPDGTGHPLVVTGKCAVTGIGQPAS